MHPEGAATLPARRADLRLEIRDVGFIEARPRPVVLEVDRVAVAVVRHLRGRGVVRAAAAGAHDGLCALFGQPLCRSARELACLPSSGGSRPESHGCDQWLQRRRRAVRLAAQANFKLAQWRCHNRRCMPLARPIAVVMSRRLAATAPSRFLAATPGPRPRRRRDLPSLRNFHVTAAASPRPVSVGISTSLSRRRGDARTRTVGARVASHYG